MRNACRLWSNLLIHPKSETNAVRNLNLSAENNWDPLHECYLDIALVYAQVCFSVNEKGSFGIQIYVIRKLSRSTSLINVQNEGTLKQS